MGVKLLMTAAQVAADEEGWLARRREGITASEIAQVLGIAPHSWGGPATLYWRKMSGAETMDADELERGRDMEPAVLGKFARSHPDLRLLPGGLYASAERPWQMATFDAQVTTFDAYDWGSGAPPVRGEPAGARVLRLLDADPGPAGPRLLWPVNAKTSYPDAEYGADHTEAMPVHYRAQLLQEMDVRGADRGYLAVRFIHPWRFRTFVIERDERAQADIEFMRGEAERFLHRMAMGDPPPVDDSEATTRALRAMYPGAGIEERAVRIPIGLARRYRRAGAMARLWQARRQEAVNDILERAGNARRIVARDTREGAAIDGYLVRVANRNCSDRAGYTVDPQADVVSLSPCGWTKGGPR